MQKRKEMLITTANSFIQIRDRIWANMKIKNEQSVVSSDDWLLCQTLLAKIFSVVTDITPALGSGLDDTLHKLDVCKEDRENKFVVLINMGFLLDTLVKHVQQTKFLMCFSPGLFWEEPTSTVAHFREFSNME
jgi:hypothetical protein